MVNENPRKKTLTSYNSWNAVCNSISGLSMDVGHGGQELGKGNIKGTRYIWERNKPGRNVTGGLFKNYFNHLESQKNSEIVCLNF